MDDGHLFLSPQTHNLHICTEQKRVRPQGTAKEHPLLHHPFLKKVIWCQPGTRGVPRLTPLIPPLVATNACWRRPAPCTCTYMCVCSVNTAEQAHLTWTGASLLAQDQRGAEAEQGYKGPKGRTPHFSKQSSDYPVQRWVLCAVLHCGNEV